MPDSTRPSPSERVTAILDGLAEVYTPEGVGAWLFGAHRLLDGESAMDLLRRGEYERVEALIDQLQSGAFV